jgi:hypothetical protein
MERAAGAHAVTDATFERLDLQARNIGFVSGIVEYPYP